VFGENKVDFHVADAVLSDDGNGVHAIFIIEVTFLVIKTPKKALSSLY
jgi:hypothetical protein